MSGRRLRSVGAERTCASTHDIPSAGNFPEHPGKILSENGGPTIVGVREAHIKKALAPCFCDLEKSVISATYTSKPCDKRMGVRNVTLQVVTLYSHGHDN